MKLKVLFSLCICLLSTSIHAEEEAVVHLRKDREYILAQPGGNVLGEIYSNVRMVSKETKGDYTKVNIEAWVKSKSLGGAPMARKGGGTEQLITLVGYDFQQKDYSQGEKRRGIKIKVKNISNAMITSWRGFLIAKDYSGKLLMQETISDGAANLEPGKEKELHFYWGPGDKTYQAMVKVEKEGFPISLSGVAVE